MSKKPESAVAEKTLTGKIVFNGHFGDFFITVLGLAVLTIITFGLFFPYLIYWQYKYFVTNLTIELPVQ